MLFLAKLIQKLVKTLNSDGTPGQVAAGIALGSIFGLTPLVNLHNLMMIAVVFLLNVSLPAVTLGLVIFAPVGFLLDPVFDSIGTGLLVRTPGLVPAWTAMYDVPVVPLSNYNNTIVLGSLVGWAILVLPIFFAARLGVHQYRERVLPRLQRTPIFRGIKASKLYNAYRWFHVE